MNKQTEDALRMAIDVLEFIQKYPGVAMDSVIDSCKAALESQESEQEPVAWISNDENHLEWRKGALLELGFKDNEILPLYTRLPDQSEVPTMQEHLARIAELEEQLRDREQDLAFEHSRAEKLESEKSELLETLKNTIEFCDGNIQADKQYNLIKAIIEKYEA